NGPREALDSESCADQRSPPRVIGRAPPANGPAPASGGEFRCTTSVTEPAMPSGAAVIKYEGKRGVVWRIKYRDADGVQMKETIGAERDGVTRKQAEAELRERLVRVEKKGYRRPKPLTFGVYTDTWYAEGQVKRGWQPRTVSAYGTVAKHLKEHFGNVPL